MSSNPRTSPNEPLRKWYPYLWMWSKLPVRERRLAARGTDDALLTVLDDDAFREMAGDDDLVRDLGGSLTDLTVRLAPSKRRPTPRLKQLALWNAALELRARRAEARDSASAVNDALKDMCTETQRLSDLLQPCDPETRIERELTLGCCIVGEQPRFNVGAPARAREELGRLGLDAKDVFILRNSILALKPIGGDAIARTIGVTDVAETLGVTRQTVWNRGNSLVKKLQLLQNSESFNELIPVVARYQRYPVSDTGEPLAEPFQVCYDTRDTPVGYLTSPATAEFATFRDLWQVLFYLTTTDDISGGGPFGFTWGQSNIHGRFVGSEYFIWTQDLAAGDYDEENKPSDEPTRKAKTARGGSR